MIVFKYNKCKDTLRLVNTYIGDTIMFKKEFTVKSHGGSPTYINITDQLRDAISESQISNGIAVALTKHTTCSVFFEEFTHDFDKNGNEYLQNDLNNALSKIIPDHTSAETYSYPGPLHYKDVESWPNAEEYLLNGDKSALWNGDAHLKATLLGNSSIFEVENGELSVSKTGYLYFVDFDRTRERTRKVTILIIGD